MPTEQKETKEIKKTMSEIFEANAVVAALYAKDDTLKQTKFGYAWDMFVKKNISPAQEILNEKLAVIRVDNALTSETTKEVFLDRENNRGFKYSKEGLKQCMAEENKCVKEWYAKEVEIKPYICKDVPKILTEEQKETLKGLIL